MASPLVYHFAPFRLQPSSRQLLCAGAPVKVGGRAFDMLVVLVERRERTVGKNELMDLVWPGLVVEENNLQVQVLALRKLLGHVAIATVPGRGYRFTLPVQVEGDAACAEAAPAPRAAPGRPGALPAWLPPLVGRAQDLQALLGLLERHALVTIVGPGGIGKTRLAQAAAQASAARLPGGPWWVDLASLTEPQLVPQAVAQALGLALEGAADAAAAVLAALPAQPALLVLDNAEHLLQGLGDFLSQLRAAAPALRLLITSQEVLRRPDEQVFRLEPLSLPQDEAPAAMAASDAVALFVARAQAADRRFALDDGNRAAVAEICRRLDGIPLAIELAAARLPLLGVDGLRARLDQRLQLLTSGDRSALHRHRTLRAALDWSHQLLSAPEQAVLRRAGVFAGGFTLEAAQQVAEDERGIDRWDVLDLLGALVDKSLVLAEGDALPRYRMLESTRLFALERLIESQEAAATRTRHREHFMELAEQAREWMVVGDARGLALLDRERDNLFLALAWRPAGDDGQTALRLAAALRYYWPSRGLLARGLQVSLATLAATEQQPPSAARCSLLCAAAQLQQLAGRTQDAVQLAAQALHAVRPLDDARGLCAALVVSGFAHFANGEAAQALACADEALARARQLGESRELGSALTLRSAVHVQAGEAEAALRLQQDAAALWRRLGQPWSECIAHLNLAGQALERQAPDDALPHLQRVLALLPQVDSERIGLHLVEVTSQWAAAAGLHGDATLLDAACAAQHARAGIAIRPDAGRAQALAVARAALDPAQAERLQRSGRGLTYAEVLQQLQRCLSPREAAFSLSQA